MYPLFCKKAFRERRMLLNECTDKGRTFKNRIPSFS